jgi:hypothetical protein
VLFHWVPQLAAFLFMNITNPKISSAGNPPTWAAFRGFSLLFDNPGSHLVPYKSGRTLLHLNPQDAQAGFYQRVVKAMALLNPEALPEKYHFCALPSPSYHVTVWDGVNDGNVGALAATHQADFQDLIAGFPQSLDTALLDPIRQSPLGLWQNQQLSFRFGKLSIWGNQALVVQVEAADKDSEAVLAQIESYRKALNEQFFSAFGLYPSGHNYSPHVTLAYFAHAESGKKAAQMLEQWEAVFRPTLAETTLTFSRIALYGFSDMATFFR